MVCDLFFLYLKNYLSSIAALLLSISLASAQITGITSADTLNTSDVLTVPKTELLAEPDTTKEIADSTLINSTDVKPIATENSVVQRTVKQHTLGVLDMFTNLPGDWYRWSKQSFTTDNIPLISALGVMTAGMVVTDYELWQPAKKLYDKSQMMRDISDTFVSVGDGKFQFGLAIGFGIYGVVFSDTKALKTASQVTEVILACGGVVQLLKHLTGRESPFVATTRTGKWDLLPNQIEYHKHVPRYDAFPSGHIATAMATMIVISENYPEQKWIQYIGYPAVAMVGVGLTATSIHWVSDFPLGLALGYSFGMLIAHQFDEPKKQQSASLFAPTMGITMLSNGLPALHLLWEW
jgi:hypothetical protein